jgi:GDPmannose 4,6-dehydratase
LIIGESSREFVEASFKFIGKEIKWEGSGEKEVGTEVGSGEVRVRVNSKYYR